MSSFRAAMRKYHLIIFLALTAALSWIGYWPGHKPGGDVMNALGPFAAALITLGLTGGWKGLKAFFVRAFNVTRVRPLVWSVAILLPTAVAFASAALIPGVFDRPWPQALVTSTALNALSSAPFILIFIGLGEEPAWRGFLLQSFQTRLTPLLATLAVVPIWWLWHFPLVGVEHTWETYAALLVCQVGVTILLTWLTNAAHGCTVPAMVLHTVNNVVTGKFIFSFFLGADNTRLWWIFAGIWLVIGLVVVVATRGRLGFDPADRYDPVNP